MNNGIGGALAALCCCAALAEDCRELEAMGRQQIMTLNLSHAAGEVEDLGLTLSAIAWQESQAGKYLLNVNDRPSVAVGIHHVTITSAMARSDYTDTPFNRNRLAADLLNPMVNAEYALLELHHWRRTYPNDWQRMVGGYNAGYQVELGERYAAKIAKKVAILQACQDTWRLSEVVMSDALAMASASRPRG